MSTSIFIRTQSSAAQVTLTDTSSGQSVDTVTIIPGYAGLNFTVSETLTLALAQTADPATVYFRTLANPVEVTTSTTDPATGVSTDTTATVEPYSPGGGTTSQTVALRFVEQAVPASAE